jgi:hypothetical protein
MNDFEAVEYLTKHRANFTFISTASNYSNTRSITFQTPFPKLSPFDFSTLFQKLCFHVSPFSTPTITQTCENCRKIAASTTSSQALKNFPFSSRSPLNSHVNFMLARSKKKLFQRFFHQRTSNQKFFRPSLKGTTLETLWEKF